MIFLPVAGNTLYFFKNFAWASSTFSRFLPVAQQAVLFQNFRLRRAKIEHIKVGIKLLIFSPAAGNTFSKFSPAAD